MSYTNMPKKLENSKNALETIKILFQDYANHWENLSNAKVVDEFYGSFLVDVEAELTKKFLVRAYIQKVTPKKRE